MNLALDLKYASRLMRKSWGYSLLCAGVVALSVGLSIWAWVLSQDLLRASLGLPDTGDWYSVQIAADATALPAPSTVDAYTYQKLLENNRSADPIGAYANKRVVLSEGQASTDLRGAVISPRMLAKVVPLRGRTFQDSDAQPGAQAMAIISFHTWQTYFAADPAIVGKMARMDAEPVQIIGVMPKDFYAFADFELWLPLRMTPLARPGDSTLILSPFVVPKTDGNLHAVQNEMQSVVDRVNKDYPDRFNPGRHVQLIPGRRMFTSSVLPLLVTMGVITAAILLLGAVNISFVFLARLLERSRELALRTAVGSSRTRLLGQCLLETCLIVLLGLAVGYALAALAVWDVQTDRDAWAQILGRGRFPMVTALQPGHFIAAIFFAVVVWLVSTLVPAWRISRQDAAVALAGSGKGSTAGGGGRSRSASVLVGLQVAVSSVVLVLCGAIILAVNEEVNKPTGLDSARVVLTTTPTVFSERFSEPSQRLRYWEDLTAAIESRIPGAGVAFASAAPIKPVKVPAEIETQQGVDKQGAFQLPAAVVSENYFELLGLKLRSGRLFDRTDDAESLAVAVVDEKLAARYWPGQDVLGKRVRLNPSDKGPWLTIVGVVSAVGTTPYARDRIGVVYQPLRQAAPSSFHLLARLPNSADSRSALRAAAFAVDRDLPLDNLHTFDAYLFASEQSTKGFIGVFGLIALITALIAASGLVGLISRSVAQRTQEVGIRRALGATPRGVISLFLRQGAWYLTPAFAGVGLAIVMLPPVSGVFTNVLHFSVPVAVGVVVFMAVIIFTASYLPSRRAVALEPGDALRVE
ncbi:MAG TPA: FtsX-like permease family protein [Thermoanaerobaculia bacterium]|nr:FtsX-like permease family protein [Thermoanaerobaculia bacterium]